LEEEEEEEEEEKEESQVTYCYPFSSVVVR
jgi:hypothetical protein